MPRLTPIHYLEFEAFLEGIGCVYVRSKGDHNIWQKPGLKRPVVVRAKKDLPIGEIKSNLRTLGISTQEYLQMISK